MALLQLVSEERIGEEAIDDYFDVLYRVVCVSERPETQIDGAATVRSTYILDWEQHVHVLEHYDGYGEYIVEVTAIQGDDARTLRRHLNGSLNLARA
jgi:hypothetical protein